MCRLFGVHFFGPPCTATTLPTLFIETLLITTAPVTHRRPLFGVFPSSFWSFFNDCFRRVTDQVDWPVPQRPQVIGPLEFKNACTEDIVSVILTIGGTVVSCDTSLHLQH